MKNHNLKRLAALACAILALAGCAGETPAQPAAPAPLETPMPVYEVVTSAPTATAVTFTLRPSSTPLPTETSFPATEMSGFGYGPQDFPPGINPLTGLAVSDPALLERRPMLVKISNFPRSLRPQWGLTRADHIYEYFLEDGLTRFIGIFYGQDASQVGPIRSARPFDWHVVNMYKSVFAFGFADDRIMDGLLESDIKNLMVIQKPDNCPPMCRIGSDNDYNNLFTDTHELSLYVTNRGTSNERQDLSGLRFEARTYITTGGGFADQVAIRYSNDSYHLWEYDPASQRYLRSQETEAYTAGEETYQPLFDSLTGERVAADNLVILMVPTSYWFQSNSTVIYSIDLEQQGPAYALRDGKIFEITWSRTVLEQLLTLTFPTEKPYPLKPGNVWFEVLCDTSTHEVDGKTWKFFFNLNLP
ncbi:MAG: DUF3048 domain-containing protein [Anaerolineales bacterium]|nr:DUF3048 domain-containing protein [Anaerolineales bacterium]